MGEIEKTICINLIADYKDAIKNHLLSSDEVMLRIKAHQSIYVADYEAVINITKQHPTDYYYFVRPYHYDSYKAAQSELNLRNFLSKIVDQKLMNTNYWKDYFSNFANVKDLGLGDKNIFYVKEKSE